MGITFANKTANPSQIDCDGSTKVTVAILAAPDIQTNPADIVLILDRSASMTGASLSNIQAGAKQFYRNRRRIQRHDWRREPNRYRQLFRYGGHQHPAHHLGQHLGCRHRRPDSRRRQQSRRCFLQSRAALGACAGQPKTGFPVQRRQ